MFGLFLGAKIASNVTIFFHIGGGFIFSLCSSIILANRKEKATRFRLSYTNIRIAFNTDSTSVLAVSLLIGYHSMIHIVTPIVWPILSLIIANETITCTWPDQPSAATMRVS